MNKSHFLGLGLLALVILVGGYWVNKDNLLPITPSDTASTTTINTTSTITPTSYKVFEDKGHSVRFTYPSIFTAFEPTDQSQSWSVYSTSSGRILGEVLVPKSYMPGTNFSEAKFTVGRSSDANAIKTCNTHPYVSGTSVRINNYAYTKFVFSGAAAGNLYETTSYKTIKDGSCYAVEYTIHSTNIGNYPEGTVTAFDKANVVKIMESVAQSVSLIVKSAGPVACTTEAKICPDGSAVGRTGPQCQFSTCPGVSPIANSGVAGVVTIGPTCPVVRDPPDPMCNDKPYSTSLLITSSTGKRTYTRSDSEGRYGVSLAVGTYTISGDTTVVMPRLSPVTFTISKNEILRLNLIFDSGIR